MTTDKTCDTSIKAEIEGLEELDKSNVIISFGDEEIKIPKVQLLQLPFFKLMLEGGMTESKSGIITFLKEEKDPISAYLDYKFKGSKLEDLTFEVQCKLFLFCRKILDNDTAK